MRKILGFNGLRAVAVILVFGEHKFRYDALNFYTMGVDVGKVGVWTFFFISGFLIIGELHRARSAIERGARDVPGEIRVFFVKRVLRIVPAYYAVLCVMLVARPLFAGLEPNIGYGWHFAFLSNVWMGAVVADTLGPFTPFWSLAIEQQFYLIAPFVLLLVPARWHGRLLAAAIGASLVTHLALYAAGVPYIAIYMLSPWSFAILMLGGCCYLAAAAELRVGSVAMAAACIGMVVFASHKALFPTAAYALDGWFDAGLTAATGVFVLWVATNQASVLVRALEWRPLAGLGVISYGFYLLHDLVPTRLEQFAVSRGQATIGPVVSYAASVIVIFALGVLLACGSWFLLEQPLLRLKPRLVGSPVRRPAE